MIDTFSMGEEDLGVRLDKLLTLKYPSYSRTYFQALLEDGWILLNDSPLKKRYLPSLHDEITVHFRLKPELTLTPEAIPLTILYEDDDLLAIDKPPGLVVHPAPGHPSGTLVNALLYHCKSLASLHPLRPGIVHRLDKETSGVLIAAKNELSHRLLVEQFAKREVQKEYLAISLGAVASQVVDAPIGRSPVHRKEMAVVEGGREAVTSFTLLERQGDYALLLAQPKTGRTHQIRVHLRHIGGRLLGDSVYGTTGLAKRPMLHAHRLFCLHPKTKTPLAFEAPIPEDMKSFSFKYLH